MPIKKWIIPNEDAQMAAILAEECGIGSLTASVLAARGHTTYDAAMRFLRQEDELSSPYELADMEKAVNRILEAIEAFEKITVYGDYDCDGVTATAVLYTYLCEAGANVDYYIPAREGEGYGLNNTALLQISQTGTTLIITVDNGISAIEETEYAKTLGMDLVITDHHQPGEAIPNAVAVIDPHRRDDKSRFKPLAGVGVAFKLVTALQDGDYQSSLEYFSDLVAIGTIADIVSLTGENRTLVKRGLTALSYSENAGLTALLELSQVDRAKLTPNAVAFSLVPRINAAGRMGHASKAVSLLLCEDAKEALQAATELDELNRKRQGMEASILAEIEAQIKQNPQLVNRRVFVAKGKGWHLGILGIVCSRLVDRLGKPVLLMTNTSGNDDSSDITDEVFSGSARSLGDFHLFKALSSCSGQLLRFGGHKLAAGFSVLESSFDGFCEALEKYACEYHPQMPPACITFDKVLCKEDLTLEQVELLSLLEPFGCENEAPLFLLKNVSLVKLQPISSNKHLRLTVSVFGKAFSALLFGRPLESFYFQVGALLDLAVTVQINEYNSQRQISLTIKDLRPADFAQGKIFQEEEIARKIFAKEKVTVEAVRNALPSREDIAGVYRYLKKINGFSGDFIALFMLLPDKHTDYCKLLMILEILKQGGLITCSGYRSGITLQAIEGKVDLDETPLMKYLTNA